MMFLWKKNAENPLATQIIPCVKRNFMNIKKILNSNRFIMRKFGWEIRLVLSMKLAQTGKQQCK